MLAEPRTTRECPALESGDRLTSAEFRRRYGLRPDIKRAELIDGVVYVASPVRFSDHADPHGILVGILAVYRLSTAGVRLGDNGTVRFPDGDEVQPDALLRRTARYGGRSREDADHYIVGSPELCAEVAASSASYLHPKKDLYRRNGVQEYIVWRTEDETIDWWQLVDGDYVPLPVEPDGSIRSLVFPGLVIVPAQLLAALRSAADEDEGGD